MDVHADVLLLCNIYGASCFSLLSTSKEAKSWKVLLKNSSEAQDRWETVPCLKGDNGSHITFQLQGALQFVKFFDVICVIGSLEGPSKEMQLLSSFSQKKTQMWIDGAPCSILWLLNDSGICPQQSRRWSSPHWEIVYSYVLQVLDNIHLHFHHGSWEADSVVEKSWLSQSEEVVWFWFCSFFTCATSAKLSNLFELTFLHW